MTDRFRLREVSSYYEETSVAFMKRFQTIADVLKPDQRIHLKVDSDQDRGILKEILDTPQSKFITALDWGYKGSDTKDYIPLLLDRCPELSALNVFFEHSSGLDFVYGMLESPSCKLDTLELGSCFGIDAARFFEALKQSRVTSFVMTNTYTSRIFRHLYDYLRLDLLTSFELWTHHSEVHGLMKVLADCTRLATLRLLQCNLVGMEDCIHFPKSITTLTLYDCMLVNAVDWSFLEGGNLKALCISHVHGVDGAQLGNVLRDHTRRCALNALKMYRCEFVNIFIEAMGCAMAQIVELNVDDYVNAASVELIARALQSDSGVMRMLTMRCASHTSAAIEGSLCAALRHPNCILTKMTFYAPSVTVYAMERRFHSRLAMLVLLEGRQVRRFHCALRKLPVELFRMVGALVL